tara:strand:+ start:1393 stop:1503 length:111 start_codon:yes stop_codon:yes gene_type:complete
MKGSSLGFEELLGCKINQSSHPSVVAEEKRRGDRGR